MNILNAATIARIQFVADCAHEDVALTTLKNAKDGIQNRTKIHAGYESVFAGVDMVLLNSLFADALAARTKAAFNTFIEAIQAVMIDAAIELEKAAEERRAAEAHQNTVMNYTGADFIEELYDAHTEALDEEHARNAAAGIVVKDSWARACPEALEQDAAPVISEAEAMQATFWGANDYAARRNLVNAAHAEALEIDRATDERWLSLSPSAYFNALPEGTPHRSKVISAAHAAAIEIDKERTAYRLWGAYLNEDFAGRRRMVEAAHSEALALDRVYNVMHADFVDPVRRTGSR